MPLFLIYKSPDLPAYTPAYGYYLVPNNGAAWPYSGTKNCLTMWLEGKNSHKHWKTEAETLQTEAARLSIIDRCTEAGIWEKRQAYEAILIWLYIVGFANNSNYSATENRDAALKVWNKSSTTCLPQTHNPTGDPLYLLEPVLLSINIFLPGRERFADWLLKRAPYHQSDDLGGNVISSTDIPDPRCWQDRLDIQYTVE